MGLRQTPDPEFLEQAIEFQMVLLRCEQQLGSGATVRRDAYLQVSQQQPKLFDQYQAALRKLPANYQVRARELARLRIKQQQPAAG